MSAADQTTAANDAAELVIDEGNLDSILPVVSLLDEIPEIPATPESYKRIEKHRTYRGAARTEVDDFGWNAVLYATKILAGRVDPLDQYSDLPELVCDSLISLKDSRPAKQLFIDFCAEGGLDDSDAWEAHWDERAARKPADDYHSLLILAECYGWPSMQNRPKPTAPSEHVTITDFMDQPEPSWLVEHVLMLGSILAAVFGEPGSGKSTIVLEMLLAIARGIKWHGRDVEQGAVAYLAAESVVGLRKRLMAYEKAHNIERDSLTDTFFPIPTGLNLSDPTDVDNLIRYLKTLPTPYGLRVVAIDTLAMVTPGVNENSSDMNVPLKACKRIHEATGAIILLIAHSGKNQALGIRGWSGILGALDSEIEVAWDKDADVRSVTVRKQRDGESNVPLFDCTLQQIAYGRDSKGRELTSVVVNEAPPQDLPTSKVRQAIRDVFDVVGRPMTFSELVKAAKVNLDPPDAGKKDRRRERIKATYRRMVADNTLMVREGMISLVIPFAPVPALPAASDADTANSDLIQECQP